MPARGAAAVVVAQRIAPPVALEITPNRMDMVAPGVVELDQKRRTLDAKVVRLATRERARPAEADRIQAASAHPFEPLLQQLRPQVLGEGAHQTQEQRLFGGA